MLSQGVGADDPEVPTRPQVLVRHASRNNDDIAALYRENNPLLAPELHARLSLKHPKDFMCRAMVVMHTINTIAPLPH